MHEVHDMQDSNDPDIVMLTHTATTNERMNHSMVPARPATK